MIQDHERAYFDSADWALEKVFMSYHVKCILGRAEQFFLKKFEYKVRDNQIICLI